MPKVQQTLTITIDDRIFEVANMSQEVQNAVMYMDEWRQEEADLTSKLLMVRGAINDVKNTLLKTIQDEIAAQAQPEDAPAEAKKSVRKSAKKAQ